MSKRKTTLEFAKEVENLTNGEYILMGEYSGARIKTKFIHVTCNTTFEMIPTNFLKNNTLCIIDKLKL